MPKENFPDEWTQQEFLENRARLEKEGIKVLLIDTILADIERVETVRYNPFELKQEPEGTVFVFYCDTGKDTLNRLSEYREKFPNHPCISLRGGRGYWRKYMNLKEDHAPSCSI